MIKTINGDYYTVFSEDGNVYGIQLCEQTNHILTSISLKSDVESLYNAVQSRLSQLDNLFENTKYPPIYYEYFVGEHKSGNFKRAENLMKYISSIPFPTNRDNLIGWYAYLYSVMKLLDAVQETYDNIIDSMSKYPDVFIQPKFGIPDPSICYVKHLHKYKSGWI